MMADNSTWDTASRAGALDRDRVPTLVIGLGGAGGQIVARVKRLVRQVYGDRPQISRLVNYLVVDADKFENLDALTRRVILPRSPEEGGEFLSLAGFNPRQRYDAYLGLPGKSEDLKAWFPEEDRELLPNQRIDNGAARCRPLGRFLLYSSPIESVLSRKIAEAFEQRDTNVYVENRQLRVLLFCSSCGGTGSSCLVDVLFILHRLVQRQRHVAPVVDLFALGPEPFVKANTEVSIALEPYLRANSFAFFREIDFLLKHPDRFNEIAMDALSAGRSQGGVESLTGLPPDQRPPLDNIYVFDGSVPAGVGDFQDLSALYDYVARASFYAKFVPEVRARLDSLASNVERFKGLDKQRERRKSFAALGVAEVCTGDDFTLRYLQLRSARDGLLRGLVGDSYPDFDSATREVCSRLQADIDAACTTLIEEIRRAGDQGLELLMNHDQFRVNEKVKWDLVRKADESLRGAERDLMRSVDAALMAQDTLLHQKGSAVRSAFQAQLDALCATLCDGQGVIFLERVLTELNKRLERDIEVEVGAMNSSQEAADGILEALPQGKGDIGSLVTHLIDRKDERLLFQFLDDLIAYRKHAVAVNLHRLKAELLRRLAGDVGRDATPMEYNEGIRRYQVGVTSVRSPLDSRIEELASLRLHLTNLAGSSSPYEVFREERRVAQTSPTMHILTMENQESLDREFAALFPEWAHPNDRDRQKARAERNKEILRTIAGALDRPEIGPVDLKAMGQETWTYAIEEYVTRCFHEQKRPSIADRMRDSGEAGEFQKMLWRNSEPGVRIQYEAMVDRGDIDEIVRSVFIGSPGATLDAFAQEGGSSGNSYTFPCPDDRWVYLRARAVLPIWVFSSIEAQSVYYHTREVGNRPHIDHRFNRGLLEEWDPSNQGSVPDATEVFFSLYAVSLLLGPDWKTLIPEEDHDRRDQLVNDFRRVAWFDSMTCMRHNLPPLFLYQVLSGPPEAQGVYGIPWELAWREGRGVLHVQGRAPRPLRILPLPMSRLQDRQQVLDQYRSQQGLYRIHARFLIEILHGHPAGRTLLEFAAESLERFCLKQLETLRGTPLYGIARNLSAALRSTEQRRILADEAFYEKASLELSRIQKRLSSDLESLSGPDSALEDSSARSAQVF